jgi:hypothetical protein
MPMFRRARAPSAWRRRKNAFPSSVTRRMSSFAVVLLLSGCAARPEPPIAGADPAEPAAVAKSLRPASTIGHYVRRQPVDPGTEARR